MRYQINQKPQISVILPVFNAEKYLAQALESLRYQTYKNFEVIAIDDGSTDTSYQILKTYAKLDPRFRIYKNPKNLNIARTLNRGLKLAKGQYIARMDADDISLPNRFSQQLKYLKKHPNVVILGGQCKTMDTTDKLIGRKLFPISHKQITEALYTTNPIQHPTVMINRSLIPQNFSWYNPELPPAEDYDLFFRLGQFGKYHNLPNFLLIYRQYLGSSTFTNPTETFNVTRKVRSTAIHEYGYEPSKKAILTHNLQVALIKIIPGFLIYPLYVLVRGIKSPLQLLADYLGELSFFPQTTPKSNKLSV